MPSPTNGEQVDAVDHRTAAIDYLNAVTLPYDEPPAIHVGMANAYATLALVDEVAKLRELFHGGGAHMWVSKDD